MKLLAFAMALFTFAELAPAGTADPSFVVHILGYVRKDYGEAVDDKGKIKSPFEYQEQIDFIKAAIEAVEGNAQLKADNVVTGGLANLMALVKQRSAPSAVASRCVEVQGHIMKVARIQSAPLHWPSRHAGRDSYEKNCASCHGVNGHGDGPAGKGLDPKPADFHDVARMSGATPFELFSTIKLGVPGTGMASFEALSEAEIWNLAFFLAGMRHEGKPTEKLPPDVSLQTVASGSDEQLERTLSAAQVRALRLHQPASEREMSTALAKTRLDEAVKLLYAGDRRGAKQMAVMAYLDGIEPIEPRLRARDSDLVVEIERQMGDVRAAIDAGHDAAVLSVRVETAKAVISKAEQVLSRSESSAGFTFTVAAGIFLREAFEAVLIIITLLGVIRSIGSRQAALYVHGGWMLALGFGLAAWFFSGWIMAISGAQRELLEGGISLFAVAVLLYFGFWLHRKTEIGKWRAFLSEMVQNAVDGKNLVALGVISFMAVFREAFETVLFLRALLLESGANQIWPLTAGVLVSFVFVVLLAAALVKFSVRIPIRQLFGISSVVMVLLSFILIGKGVHSFQETGLLTITQLPVRLRVELIGFYPTFETMIAQIAVLFLAGAFWLHGKRSSNLARQAV